MRVLLISNQHRNENGVGNPIMYRLLDALRSDERVDYAFFKPFSNSISSLFSIRKSSKDYDVVHIHFGGLYALAIRFFLFGTKCKKVITFHGTDIHAKQLHTTKNFLNKIKIFLNQKASFLSLCLFDRCGFVASDLISYIPFSITKRCQHKYFIQPLGVDYSLFKLDAKNEAINSLQLNEKKWVLFSDVSNTQIKRRDIAEAVVAKMGCEYDLLIMCGVASEDVPKFINACDCLLLTSDEEGSPNIVREALALNKPVFSVPVGDVRSQINGLQNSCLISRDPSQAAITILEMLNKPYIDNTRNALEDKLNIQIVNRSIVSLYCTLI